MSNPNIIDDAWLEYRGARAQLEEAIEYRSQSHGLGKVIGTIAVKRAERSVKDTGEHLDFVEELHAHMGLTESPSPDKLPDEESIGFGQIGDDEYFGH